MCRVGTNWKGRYISTYIWSEGEVTWENYMYLVLSFRSYYIMIKTGDPLAAPRTHAAIPSFPNYIDRYPTVVAPIP